MRTQSEQERMERESERSRRIGAAQQRQREADQRVYGEGSQLLAAQRSSAGGDARGGIWDVDTSDYKPKQNKDDYESDIRQVGIDSVGGFTEPGALASGGSGLPEGFAEETLDVVEDDNTAGQRVFLTKAV